MQSTLKVIGVMSGTSLDGIDFAYCHFWQLNNQWLFNIKVVETVPYSNTWKKQLDNSIKLPQDKINNLNNRYTSYLSREVRNFIAKHQLVSLDAVCSHGHTVLHNPKKKTTLQIGNLPLIAKLIGCRVICDFRVQDVLLGGQGAPLVPVGDELLFNEYDYCLNIGGFANISFSEENERKAFDICPANIILNCFSEKENQPFDKDGELAKQGTINSNLLNELNKINFYHISKPKSLGKEFLDEVIFPITKKYQFNNKDFLATLTEHIGFQIAQNLATKGKVLVTGGGAYNYHLIETIKKYTTAELIIPSSIIIEYKEALIFGFLGVLKMMGKDNCLKSVTGASKNHSSGYIYEF